MQRSAQLSRCGRYRYSLSRAWGCGAAVAFIGLNPSTADANEDDPTIRRCVRFAQNWGFDGLLMLNAFAFRSTDPGVLFDAPDPIGPGNDRALRRGCRQASLIIAAWGNHCPENRLTRILNLTEKPLHCLTRNQNGSPRHPLYVHSATVPVLYTDPANRIDTTVKLIRR